MGIGDSDEVFNPNGRAPAHHIHVLLRYRLLGLQIKPGIHEPSSLLVLLNLDLHAELQQNVLHLGDERGEPWTNT